MSTTTVRPAVPTPTLAGLLALTDRGVVRARRDGTDWTVDRSLVAESVTQLSVSPHDPAVVYAGTQHGGVQRSTDGGETWDPVGLGDRPVKSVAVSPHDPDTVYAGTKPPRIYVTRDGGERWTELDGFRAIPWRRLWASPAEPPYYRAYVQAIAISPTDPEVLLAGIEAGAVVRSDDGGRTWSGHRPGAIRDCHSLTFHATDGDWVYEAGAWLRAKAGAVSRDAGVSWQRPTDGIDRSYGWAVAADPADPAVWYISASTGPGAAHGGRNAKAMVFRTEDGGPWRAVEGLDQPLASMPYALATDPAAPDHLYIGLEDGTVWHSPDRGRTAERLPVELGPGLRTMVGVPS